MNKFVEKVMAKLQGGDKAVVVKTSDAAIKLAKKEIKNREKQIAKNKEDIKEHKETYKERIDEMVEEHNESFFEIDVDACKKTDDRKDWIENTHFDRFIKNREEVKGLKDERDATVDALKDKNDELELEIKDFQDYLAAFEGSE